MSQSLEQLLDDGVIDEVLGCLKTGKEAEVWLVRHHGETLAAKVYKDRAHRSFKNNAGYKEGRSVRNTRTQRAMDRGSRFGQAAAEEAWKAAESDALHKLHAQGVRVPAPVLFYEGILIMQLVLDAEGNAAPRLIDAPIPPEAAAGLYADLRGQAIRMLCCDLIHGDLSPYNVLLGAAGPTVIDFPQVVSAAHNSIAEGFFKRDLENLRKFFEDLDPALAARRSDAAEIWHAYVRRDLTPDFVPSGKLPPERREHAHPRAHGQQGARPQGAQAQAGQRAQPGPQPQRPAHALHGAPRGPGGARPHGAPRPAQAEAPGKNAGASPHGHQPRAPHGGQQQHGALPQHGGRPQHGRQPQQGERPQHGGLPHGGPPRHAGQPQHGGLAPHGQHPRGGRPPQAPAHGGQAQHGQPGGARPHGPAPQRPSGQHSGGQHAGAHQRPHGAGHPAGRGGPGGRGGRPGQPFTGPQPGPVVERIQRPPLPGAPAQKPGAQKS